MRRPHPQPSVLTDHQKERLRKLLADCGPITPTQFFEAHPWRVVVFGDWPEVDDYHRRVRYFSDARSGAAFAAYAQSREIPLAVTVSRWNDLGMWTGVA